jgi:hypothetical protein
MHLQYQVGGASVNTSGSDTAQKGQSEKSLRPDPFRKWGWAVFAVVIAANFYYFREMAAALVIFAVLFVIGAITAAIIYIVGRAGEAGISLAEPVAKRGLVAAEEFSKKTFHRPRSAPVP